MHRPILLVSAARYNPVQMLIGMSAWYPVKTVVLFAAVLVVALVQRRRHHPFSAFGSANQVTTVRALLASAGAGFIGEATHPAFASAIVGGAIVATVLDGVDGRLARRANMTSVFGARFDMEVDALLILVLSLLAWQYDKAGAWVMASGLLRYAFGAAGWIWPWIRQPLPSTRRAKTVCAVQIGALLATLAPVVHRPFSDTAAALGLAMLVYSFAADVRRLWLQR
jgi:phosphatidylglycerophosphate synthase